MYFLSVLKSPTIVLEQIQTIWHKTDKGETPEHTRRVAVRFSGLNEPIPCEGLPGKKSLSGRSMAQGILSVEDAARQSGLSQGEVVRRLKNHPYHGTDFVLVNDEGKVDDTYEPPPEPAMDVDRLGGHLKDSVVELRDNPHHQFLCEACQLYFRDKRGVNGHVTGKPHKENYRDWKAAREPEKLRQAV